MKLIELTLTDGRTVMINADKIIAFGPSQSRPDERYVITDDTVGDTDPWKVKETTTMIAVKITDAAHDERVADSDALARAMRNEGIGVG